MFRFIPIKAQLMDEKKKNVQLRAENASLAANVDYLAMMCDVELDDGEEEVTENDSQQEV